MKEPIGPVTVRSIDWPAILADLKRAGLSLRAVAKLTGVSKAVLVGLKNDGNEPKMRAGESITLLWARMTKVSLKEVPRHDLSPPLAQQRVLGEKGWCPLCGAEQKVKPAKDGECP